jgi:hypothetical protein
MGGCQTFVLNGRGDIKRGTLLGILRKLGLRLQDL